MNRVTHFEIPAAEPEKLADFYVNVFGWQKQKWDGPMEYWMLITGKDEPGINGAITGDTSTPGVVNTIVVNDLDEYISKVQHRGGKIASPKSEIPGMGWLAYCLDPAGNKFGIIQLDKPTL